MKQIVLVAVLAVGLAEVREPGLRVRFDVTGSRGVDYFIDMPKTVAQAQAADWVLTEKPDVPDGPMPSLSMYCFPDNVVCTLFDDTDYIAGLQVALPVDQWSDNVYDMEETGFTLWTPSVASGQKRTSYWALPQYFVNEDILRQPKDVRLAARDNNKIMPYGAVWVTGFGQKLYRIENTTAAIDASIFTKQACFPTMGHHYYYNLTTTSDSSIPPFPWFPMANSEQLIAIGFLVSGKLNKPQGAKMWLEIQQPAQVRAIVPDAPEWMYKLADKPGFLAMHIYYVEDPSTVTC